ncbi:MAG: DinB family protein [Cyclobacteriaceae bacterium]|nr:DinB family protein [Cyclobacteriaceae bacterium]
MHHNLLDLYKRDLLAVKAEVASFSNEDDLWKTVGTINNSAGNLALHISGNLLHFFGAILLKNGYIREREKEFNDKNIPKTEIVSRLEQTIDVVTKVLENFDETTWESYYPIPIKNENVTHFYFFIHLYGHLNLHLGQINYIRRGFFDK